jgi:putative DNA primase/helicase
MPGVMNWIIAGLRKFREIGLDEPSTVTDAVKAQRNDSDQVSQFLMDGALDGYITVGDGLDISQTQLYRIFESWCRDNGLTALGNRRFGMRLTALRFEQKRTATTRVRVGIGVGTRGAFGTM